MQEATDFAKELSEVVDYEAAMAMSERAQQLLDTFDPIIATADDSIRPDLEAVVAPPRSLVEAKESGDQNLNLEFSGFADGGTAVLDTCFSDTDDAADSAGTSTALIGRDTSVEAYCGTLVDGYKIDSPSTDVTTFGQAWDLIAEGQSCQAHDGEEFQFAFEDETDADGNRVPLEEYREPVEDMWEGFDDAEDAAEKVATAIDMCLYRPDDPLEDKSTPGGIRHYGSSLALCPDHPQSEQRRELMEYLPQAQAEFDEVMKEAAAEEKTPQSPEASAPSDDGPAFTGDYAADLAAIGIVPDDLVDYRQFMKRNICEADPDQTWGVGSMSQAVKPWAPDSSRLAAAYDCPELADEVEEAIDAM
ncbi:hypothetical protein ACT4S5_13195 [Kocuria oceani]|uniref:hypothetical protein n=1 Tax=Kocuria oceani TaxID=988827 RepID=UPI004035E87A